MFQLFPGGGRTAFCVYFMYRNAPATDFSPVSWPSYVIYMLRIIIRFGWAASRYQPSSQSIAKTRTLFLGETNSVCILFVLSVCCVNRPRSCSLYKFRTWLTSVKTICSNIACKSSTFFQVLLTAICYDAAWKQ